MNIKEFLALGACNGLLTQFNLQDVNLNSPYEFRIKEAKFDNLNFIHEFCTPICFSLNQLTKPIRIKDHNGGEPFIAASELCNIFREMLSININNYGVEIELIPQETIEFIGYARPRRNDCLTVYSNVLSKLIEWHFAVGLSYDEFIPVTDEFNPYV